METGNARPVRWSEEKVQHLQAPLTGIWAEDVWPVQVRERKVFKQRFLRFEELSPVLKTEFKYAMWFQFEQGRWRREALQKNVCYNWPMLRRWLCQISPAPYSLLERTEESWVWSLRDYLVQNGHYVPTRRKQLRATQTYVETVTEDHRICLFRTLYHIIADAYDDRPETEKDLWMLSRLGIQLDFSRSGHRLNFTDISQPWLREMTKEFMRYRIAVQSPADCRTKLTAIQQFSRFLAKYSPEAQASSIDRALIMTYIAFLHETPNTVTTRNKYLVSLRVVLETCSYQLKKDALPKERLIFDEDLIKQPETLSREIPEEVLVQLREHLHALPTTILRMVTILLECGLRLNELCQLPLDCLICDDKHEWYLHFYQSKSHKEHVIPLVEEKVIGTIQAQQQEVRAQWGTACQYLFPSRSSSLHPFKQVTFTWHLNHWAVKHEIKDRTQQLYRFTAHQFRHTLGMRLLNDDVPIEVVSRLLGHNSLQMTRVYARARDQKVRAELERAARKRKTVDYQGNAVKGDSRANDPEVQMTRKGIRGQTLPVGGCSRLVVLGDCSHANKCLTCSMWLTSTEDLPALKSFYERAIRLKQRATAVGNQVVINQQDHIIPLLAVRIKSLEATEMDGSLCVDDVLAGLRADLAEAESGLEEAREAGLILAAKHLERAISEIKARILALEEPA